MGSKMWLLHTKSRVEAVSVGCDQLPAFVVHHCHSDLPAQSAEGAADMVKWFLLQQETLTAKAATFDLGAPLHFAMEFLPGVINILANAIVCQI